MEFQKKELFGEAIAVDVPVEFYDVSSLRQVPDHQEVFQEKDGFDSLIIEIMEFVGNMTPTAAARFHLDDYTDEPEGIKVWELEEVKMPNLPDVPVVAILATTKPNNKDLCTAIFMLNVRLEKHDTDLLLTMNLKDVSTGNAESYRDLFAESGDSSFRRGGGIMKSVISTFEIKNYGLFHPEE